MNGSTVVLKLIVDVDNNRISPVALNGRSWELAVDKEGQSLGSVLVPGAIGNGQIVRAHIVGEVILIVITARAFTIAPLGSVACAVAARILEGWKWDC